MLFLPVSLLCWVAHTHSYINTPITFFSFSLTHTCLSASPCLNGPYTQLLQINLPLNILTPLRQHTFTHAPLNILALPWYQWFLRYPACCSDAPGQPRWDHYCLKSRVKACVCVPVPVPAPEGLPSSPCPQRDSSFGVALHWVGITTAEGAHNDRWKGGSRLSSRGPKGEWLIENDDRYVKSGKRMNAAMKNGCMWSNHHKLTTYSMVTVWGV